MTRFFLGLIIPAMAKERIAGRVRELREAVGLTQEELAERGDLRRVAITKIEGGHNYASTFAMRHALAIAFGLSLEDIVELLDGTTSISTLRKRCRTSEAA